MQPITVKAYGGRRYTRAKRLVLRRNQKTRGRFYLFLLYEVNQGRVDWAFYPGKGAKLSTGVVRACTPPLSWATRFSWSHRPPAVSTA